MPPFPSDRRGNVLVVGVVFAGLRLDAVLCASVRRDGAYATRVLAQMVRDFRFYEQTQVLLLQLQGIALAALNAHMIARGIASGESRHQV